MYRRGGPGHLFGTILSKKTSLVYPMPRLNRRANKQYEDDLVGRSNRIIIIILTITAIGTIKYLRLECKRIGRGDPIGDSWPKRLPASRPNYRGQLDDSPDHDVDDGDDDEHIMLMMMMIMIIGYVVMCAKIVSFTRDLLQTLRVQ